ncbi:MAG: SIMPL domain-containing protein [Gammaproteobacteria bacterium]
MNPSRPALLLALVVTLAAAPVAAETSRRLVTTTGEARLEVAPDIAWLSFGVSARRPTVQEARDEVAGSVERLIRLARDAGLQQEDIATAAVSVRPEFDYDPETRERRMLGYVVSRDVQLRLKDLDRLGPVMEQALGLGVTDAAPPRFETSRREEIERQALAEAAQDARDRATVIAEALGGRLGAPVHVSAGGRSRPPVPVARAGTMLAAEAGGGSETYEPGRILVTATVSADFEFTPGEAPLR